MKCSIHRWNISRALDSGQPVSSLTKLHLVHCEACREFLRLAEEMGRRLSDDAASILGDIKPGLEEKVRQAIGEPGTVSAPCLSRPRRLQLRPALAAAVALAVIGVSFFWIVRPRPAGIPRLDPLLQLETGPADLVSALQKAESPYHEELRELKKTFQSTADYLAARFDTRLGENN